MPKNVEIKKLSEIHMINFEGTILLGTHEQLEELCLALEEYLYDGPTYDELNKISTELHKEILELKKRLGIDVD